MFFFAVLKKKEREELSCSRDSHESSDRHVYVHANAGARKEIRRPSIAMDKALFSAEPYPDKTLFCQIFACFLVANTVFHVLHVFTVVHDVLVSRIFHVMLLDFLLASFCFEFTLFEIRMRLQDEIDMSSVQRAYQFSGVQMFICDRSAASIKSCCLSG